MKRRLLSLIVSLFLLGTVSAQHYTVNPHAYDNNMPIVAVIHIDNAVPATGTYEIGAFIGDEVRGSALIQSDLDNTYWMQVYYNTETESSATISFKVYDGTEEMDVDNTLAVNPEGAGTKADPEVLDVVTAVTQNSTMAAGWTWWSTPIEQNGINGLLMLENSLGSNGVTIKGENNSAAYMANLNRWVGNCPITNEASYRINVLSECTMSMAGSLADPSNHPITLVPGWSWIGYPVNQPQVVTTALAGLQPSVGDVIKSQDNSAVYMSAALGWRPATFTLNPGVGYMYSSNATTNKELVFGNVRDSEFEFVTEEKHWNANHRVAEHNITMLAVVNVDGKELRSDAVELVAFINGECRGNSRLFYIEPLDSYYVVMTITGEEGDLIEFKLFNNQDGSVNTDCNTLLTFVPDAVFGEPANPYPIVFGSNSLKESAQMLRIFPNPVGKNQLFTFDIPQDEIITTTIITDVTGGVVSQSNHTEQVRHNRISVAGLYFVKVVCESGRIYYGRVIVD